jgi:AAA domain-containing protein
MPSFSEQVDYSNLFCLFKGEPGTRKSSCALSFPKPIYYFDYDGKIDALGLPIRAWNIDPKLVDSDYFSDWDSAKQKLELMQAQCKYKTIVIDSITSLADAINRQTLKTKQADGGSGKRVGTIPVNSIEDFNAEDSALKEMIALCKQIKRYQKVNIVLIAHVVQKEMKSPDGKTHMARLIVTAGKAIAQKIPAYCSEVYHFNIKMGFDKSQGGQYSLFTVHTGDDMARSSLPLPEEINFGSDQLYEKWIKPAIDRMNMK